ncbi:hypothetical protein FJT64_015820 [Amphibalanus amphitrite]|uniref:Helitron helicase-like domain-containing protein n=1 Tax=Amphibalanus amphitrite TaxID=1232801 RepID=A0A6A4X332_AMPAM|nr:hypothetical protein FJT64_015820 [Amphibalanus amphitrite]
MCPREDRAALLAADAERQRLQREELGRRAPHKLALHYSREVYVAPPRLQLGQMDVICAHCGALRWRQESPGACRHAGKLASMGCQQVRQPGWNPVFTVHGTDRIGSLLPAEGAQPEYLQIYFYDRELEARMDIHILIIVRPEDRTADNLDAVISPELPDQTQSDQARRLHDIVLRTMVHRPCNIIRPVPACIIDGRCDKGFPKPYAAVTEWRDDSLYPVYRRRVAADGGQETTHFEMLTRHMGHDKKFTERTTGSPIRHLN